MEQAARASLDTALHCKGAIWGHQKTGYSVARSRSVVFSLRNLEGDPESVEQREGKESLVHFGSGSVMM